MSEELRLEALKLASHDAGREGYSGSAGAIVDRAQTYLNFLRGIAPYVHPLSVLHEQSRDVQ